MIISSNAGLIRTWLVTQERFDSAPVGVEISVLSDNTSFPEPFTGKLTVATLAGEQDKTLVSAGWEDAPLTYPNGVKIVEGANIEFTKTKAVDPIPEVSDEDLIASIVSRGLIHAVDEAAAIAAPVVVKP
jgi:hypothetical protein